MAHINEQNTTPSTQCLADKARCYKKMCRPGCHRCYMKKGGCSLAQGRRKKEDDDDVGPAAGCQERIEELLEGLGRKMDGITEVLRVGLEKIAEKVEQGVDETHNYRKTEMIKRRREAREAGRRFEEKGVGNEVEEPEEPVEPTGPSGPVELVVEWG